MNISSGNVWATLLLADLLKSGQAAIAVVVGSYESVIAGKNTLATLKSLDTVARRNKTPLVMYFANNGDNSHRKEADQVVRTGIAQLCVLASRYHKELDTQDILNWLRYDRTTTVEPQLSLLTIGNDVKQIGDEVRDPISIASLMLEDHTSNIGSLRADYQVTGFMDPTCPLVNETVSEFHFVINVADVPALVEMIDSEVNIMTDRVASRAKNSSYAKPDDGADDQGMVF